MRIILFTIMVITTVATNIEAQPVRTKLYQNQKFGFQLSYSEKWQEDKTFPSFPKDAFTLVIKKIEQPHGAICIRIKNLSVDDASMMRYLESQENRDTMISILKQAGAVALILDHNKTSVSNLPAYEYILMMYRNNNATVHTEISCAYQKRLYSISIVTDVQSFPESYTEFKRIMETFKFL